MMLKHKKHGPVRRRIGNVELEVCWRDDTFGAGPCFSVFKHGREVLRFDLFDVGAHWHDYREATQPRHYFARDGASYTPADSCEAQARLDKAPPWDVRVRAAHLIAAGAHRQLADITVGDWLRRELDARYRDWGTRPAHGV